MSDVESTVQPFLKPMLVGAAVSLGDFEQVTIRAWVVLRAMILERAGAAKDAKPYYTVHERRRFGRIDRVGALEPPAGMFMWLFHFRSSRWAARSNVANLFFRVDATDNRHHVQVITALVGRFGFQIVVGRWPSTHRFELNSPMFLDWADATILMWPDPPTFVHWPPPGGYLADDTVEPFMDRWKDGLPLRRIR